MEMSERTEAWRLALGTTPGYALEGQTQMPEADFAKLYMEAAEAVYAETGVYISAVMHPARMLYHRDWGCPAGGELGYALSGVRNPRFCEREPYLAALDALVRRLKARLGQSAVHLELSETALRYYTDEEAAADE